MTEPHPTTGRELVKRAGRVALGPITERLDYVRRDLEQVQGDHASLQAELERIDAAHRRLDAYLDRFREEIRAEVARIEGEIGTAEAVARSLVAELQPDAARPYEIGTDLRLRVEHALLHAEALTAEAREHADRQLADLRGSTRLTQALVERALAAPGPAATTDTDAGGATAAGSTPAAGPAPTRPDPGFTHPTPSFDLLYRAFEDRHRGTDTAIAERQREDYLELITALPHPDLPVADLGCGRGELVLLLGKEGIEATGVDANLGQVVGGDTARFVEDDLFRWLDAQEAGSQRAVTAMHVVEHLPLDLQVRLVFDAHRVLAEGGVLILETPNTLSLSTAATNFWVDPTHERPVHPLFLEFLATEAGFAKVELRPLHRLDVAFAHRGEAPGLPGELESLLFGSGDIALVAHR